MGVDLTLILVPYSTQDNPLAYSRLALDRDRELWARIEDCRMIPLGPAEFVTWYGDEGLEQTQENPYGDVVEWLWVSELARLDVSESSHWNEAVWAMLRALPNTHKVYLWWH